MSTTRHRVLGLVGLCTALGSLGPMTSCGPPPRREAFAAELARLQQLLLADGAEILEVRPVHHGEYSAAAEWDLRLVQSWPDYIAWSKGQLQPEFEQVATDPERLEFRRTTEGEVLTVRLQRREDDRVRVEIEASAW